MKVSSFTLQNQLKVIYAKDNSNPLVCIQLYVRMGSAWEEDTETGLSHFTEHMVFKNTKNFPDGTLSEKVTFSGGHINAYTEYDSTCYYVTLPAEFFNEGLEIISQLVSAAEFREADFKAEKSVILKELKQFQDDPEDYFLEEIAADYFKYNPYRKPIIGEISKLKDLQLKDVKGFYEKYYIPNNCYLSITGDVPETKFESSITKFFGNWKMKKLNKKIPPTEYFPVKPGYKRFKKVIKSNILAFVLPDLADSNPDSYPLSLITKAFSIGKKSRLYTRLFTQEKLVDSVKTHTLSGINNGITMILVHPKLKTSIERIIEIFMDELQLIYNFGLNDIEIENYKKDLIFYYRYTYEYNESLASSLGSEELLSRYENFLQYPEKINGLSRSDINEAVQKYYKPEYTQVYQLGKKETDENRIRQILNKKTVIKSRLADSNKVYTGTMPNGMKIILKKVLGKPTLGISLTSEVSQLNENTDQLGLNLLTSGLLLYGNANRSYEQLLNYCSENGLHMGISPKSETTSLNVKCFKERMNIALELLSEIIRTPVFPNNHLDNLKQTNISNFSRIKDYPQYYANRLWKEMIFGKNSNLISSLGTGSTIRKVSLKKIKEWYKRYYNYTDMTLSIAGDFNFDLALNTIDHIFPTAEKHNGRREQIPQFNPTDNKIKTSRLGNNQSYINIGAFGCNALQFEKNTAFHVLAQIIGGDMNSLLFNEIREKRGLAYSIDFDFRSIRSLGYFNVSAIVDRNKEQETIDTVIEVLNDVKLNGITASDLEKTKNYIRGQRLLDEESMLSQAQTLSLLETLGFGYDFYLKRDERLNNVDLDIIHKIADEYFNQKDYFVHILK